MMLLNRSRKHPPVLLLTDDMSIGGMERVVANLCRELKRGGEWSPIVEYFEVPGDATYEEELRRVGVPLHCVLKEQGFSFKRCLQIVSLALRHRVKILHTHDLGPLIYGVAAKLMLGGRVKIVHTQHSFVHLRENPRYRRHEQLASRFVDKLCVVGPAVQHEYRRLGITHHDSRLLPNGIAFAGKPIAQRERYWLRRKLSATLTGRTARRLDALIDANWIVSVARIHPVKGQHRALAMWNSLPAEVRRRSTLIFVGPPVTFQELKRLLRGMRKSRDRERLIYAGPSLSPASWLRAANVFLSGSDVEGMPLSPMEAIGMGLPCLLSDIEAHRPMRANAELFALEDPEDGAAKLAHWVERAEKEGDALHRHLWSKAAEFRAANSAEKMAQAYAEVYRSVA